MFRRVILPLMAFLVMVAPSALADDCDPGWWKVSGYVMHNNGASASGVKVGYAADLEVYVITDFEGYYEFCVPDGYLLQLWFRNDLGCYEFTEDPIVWPFDGMTVVTGPIAVQTIDMGSRNSHTLEGVITDYDGAPVEGVEIRQGNEFKGDTEADGSYTVDVDCGHITYPVEPYMLGYDFVPEEKNMSGLARDVYVQNFTGWPKATLTVNSPYAGEFVPVFAEYDIEWDAAGPGAPDIDYYFLDIAIDGGGWERLDEEFNPDARSHSWSVSDNETQDARIRLQAWKRDCPSPGTDRMMGEAVSGTFSIIRSFLDHTPAVPADFATAARKGAAWVDYANSNWYGLFTTTDTEMRVYVPPGWSDWTEELGLDTYSGDPRGIAVADYNNDGYVDLYVTGCGSDNVLFKNVSGSSFFEVSPSPGHDGCAESAAWVDYDMDGNVDLYVTYSTASGPQSKKKNALYKNLGPPDYTFVEILNSVVQIVAPSVSAVWADYDNDGDPDLYVTTKGDRDYMVRNNNPGFTDLTSVGLHEEDSESNSAAWGDFNNDGYLDLYVTNAIPFAGGNVNVLYSNDGDGTFTEVIEARGSAADESRSASWVDYDGDRLLDLYVTNKGGDGSGPYNQLYKQAIIGGSFGEAFEHAALVNTGNSYGQTWADTDGDGDPDLFLADEVVGSPGVGDNKRLMNFIDDPGVSWLRLRLVTHADGVTNRSAIGAKIEVRTGYTSQYREIGGGGSFYSQNARPLEFAVPGTTVDEVVVSWPSGRVTELTGVSVAAVVIVNEPAGGTGGGGGCKGCDPPAEPTTGYLPGVTALLGNSPNPFNPTTSIRYDLAEPGYTEIIIYNVAGRRVRRVSLGELAAGSRTWTWDGLDAQGQGLGSGVYYVTLRVNNHLVGTQKALLLK